MLISKIDAKSGKRAVRRLTLSVRRRSPKIIRRLPLAIIIHLMYFFNRVE